jgi:hypothetical protein
LAPVYYRLLLSGAPLDKRLAERIVDSVWPALAAASSKRRAAARRGAAALRR